MTREEAIVRIKEHKYIHKMDEPRAILISEALEMAIKALEQEPCEDAISRRAAIASIKNLYPDMPIMDIFEARRKWLEKYAPYFECENAVEQLPSVNPQEPKTGRWTRELIRNEKGGCIGAKMICSRCDNDNKYDEYMNYCPNCGAKMVKSQESEEVNG